MGARYELSTSGRYGQRSKFCFFSHIFRWEAFFLCRIPWPCSSRHVPWRQALFSRVAGSPALHRAPLNELRPVHHEAVFGAPGLAVPEKGVSGIEYPSCTGNACFLHRMPQKMRRAPEEAFLSTARIFRTVGGPLRYRISQMPERRKVLPAPNLSNCQKREGHGPEHVPECRREQENNSLRPQNTNALHNLPVTTATHPTTSIHSHLPSHHSYTPSYTLGQQKTPPIQNTTSIHSHPPPAVRKARLSKSNRPSRPFWQGWH